MTDANRSKRLRRIRIPFVLDIVFVSEPADIRQVEASEDVDRLHVYQTNSLPKWVQFYFKSTKFHDKERDLWFCPFESAANPTYESRKAYLVEKVATGYSQEDVQRIAHLLIEGVDEATLAYEMVLVVNQRFFDEKIPRSVTQVAQHTVQNFVEALSPPSYKRGCTAQQEVIAYCEEALGEDVHILDIGHNIGEIVQSTVPALRTLQANLDKPVEEIFTAIYPPTPQVPRIAIKSSTLDGLLSSPMVAGQTVLLLQNGKAAAGTKDLHFTFGVGSPDRICIFMDFFIAFMKDLQMALRAAASEPS